MWSHGHAIFSNGRWAKEFVNTDLYHHQIKLAASCAKTIRKLSTGIIMCSESDQMSSHRNCTCSKGRCGNVSEIKKWFNCELQRKHYSPVCELCWQPMTESKHVHVVAIQICRRTQRMEYSDRSVLAAASQVEVLQTSRWRHCSAVYNRHKLCMLTTPAMIQQAYANNIRAT